MTPTNDTGNPIQVPNAAGVNLINDVPTPRFQYFTDSIALLGVDPELVALLTTQEVWEGVQAGEITGFTIGTDADPDSFGFAMELWTGVSGDICSDTGVLKHGYFLQPWLKGGAIDAITWANDAINFTITGAVTQDGNQWGVGPYDVTLDDSDAPAPLRVPLPEKKHFLYDAVLLDPPEPECGGQPVGTAATTITAGQPATLTPSGSYAPYNLTELQASAVTKSPTTAWATGTYVVLEDGSEAYWNGTAWVAGRAT